jgi:beta-glucosidase
MDISGLLNSSHAVLDAFYPGVHGAAAIAATLFGDASPGGKLPYTFYRANYASRCDMDDFSMAKPACPRGYRYLNPNDPDIIFPFGFGLSYTEFSVALSPNSTGPFTLENSNSSNAVTIEWTVKNIGRHRGAETVLAYFSPHNKTNPGGADLVPLQRQLVGYAKVDLAIGESATASVTLSVAGLARANVNGDLVSMVGGYTIILSTGDSSTELTLELTIDGTDQVLESLPPGL